MLLAQCGTHRHLTGLAKRAADTTVTAGSALANSVGRIAPMPVLSARDENGPNSCERSCKSWRVCFAVLFCPKAVHSTSCPGMSPATHPALEGGSSIHWRIYGFSRLETRPILQVLANSAAQAGRIAKPWAERCDEQRTACQSESGRLWQSRASVGKPHRTVVRRGLPTDAVVGEITPPFRALPVRLRSSCTPHPP